MTDYLSIYRQTDWAADDARLTDWLLTIRCHEQTISQTKGPTNCGYEKHSLEHFFYRDLRNSQSLSSLFRAWWMDCLRIRSTLSLHVRSVRQ